MTPTNVKRSVTLDCGRILPLDGVVVVGGVAGCGKTVFVDAVTDAARYWFGSVLYIDGMKTDAAEATPLLDAALAEDTRDILDHAAAKVLFAVGSAAAPQRFGFFEPMQLGRHEYVVNVGGSVSTGRVRV